MNNTQKILLIIGIVIIIVILELLLYSKMNNLVDDTLKELENLKISLKEEIYEKSKIKSEEINKKWFEYENKLLLFVKHEEIEKVSLKMTIILENTQNKEYKTALENLMETKFLLENIKDKNKLKLENIF